MLRHLPVSTVSLLASIKQRLVRLTENRIKPDPREQVAA